MVSAFRIAAYDLDPTYGSKVMGLQSLKMSTSATGGCAPCTLDILGYSSSRECLVWKSNMSGHFGFSAFRSAVGLLSSSVDFSQNKSGNDGNFVFPIISTPNKLKKYFSCSFDFLLLVPQVWKIAKIWILKKTICPQLGEFLFLANICSHSFLHLLSL